MKNEIGLLQASLGGDTRAFEQIVREYQSLVCAITFSRTGRVDISEELAQETFLSAWKNLSQLKDLAGFRGGICAIARNMIHNYYRKKKTISLETVDFSDFPAGTSNPSETLIEKEEYVMLEQALMQIPVEYREPLVMFYRQGKSTKEVAENLELNESTVRTRMHRARQMIREQIAQRLEMALEETGPKEAFTKVVMVAISGAAVGIGASASASATASSGGSGISAGITAVMNTVTAKIIATAAAVVVVVGGAVYSTNLIRNNQAAGTEQVTANVQVVQNEEQQEPEKTNKEIAVAAVNRTDIHAAVVDKIEKVPDSSAAKSENVAVVETVKVPSVEVESVIVEEEAVEEVDPGWVCKGIVTDSYGNEVTGAHLILYHAYKTWNQDPVIEETESNAEGAFEFASRIRFLAKTDHSYAKDHYAVIALHPDYALGWQTIRQGRESGDCQIFMTEPRSCRITVVDHDDNPLEGVRVWTYSFGDRKSNNPVFHDYLGLKKDIGIAGGWTDAEGKVTVKNLPKTSCSFRAKAPGYAEGLAFSAGRTIRLSQGTTVQGRLLTEEGQPVEGAVIRFHTDWMWSNSYAKTNEEGQFTFEDLAAKGWDMSLWGKKNQPGNGLYEVTVEHADYCVPEKKVQLLPGEHLLDYNLTVSVGTLVKCLIVEKGTNKPIAGARVYGSNKVGRLDDYSDENGYFIFRAIPGPTRIYDVSPPDGVYIDDHNNETLSFQVKGDEMEVIYEAAPIIGKLVYVMGYAYGPDGQIRPGTNVYAHMDERFHSSTAGSYVRPTSTDEHGLFVLSEVPDGMNMHVYAETKDRSLAGVGIYEIPKDPNWPVKVDIHLIETQSCDLVIRDQDGQPISKKALDVYPMVGDKNVWGGYGRTFQTDENGVLKTNGIIPGLPYFLRDKRYQRNAISSEDRSKLFQRRIVLIPLKE